MGNLVGECTGFIRARNINSTEKNGSYKQKGIDKTQNLCYTDITNVFLDLSEKIDFL